MTKTDFETELEKVRYFDYGKHKPLVNLSCLIPAETEEIDGKIEILDEECEIIFAVPCDWLVNQRDETWQNVKDWLDNEYTSEESQIVLENAIKENKVAFWKIN